MQKFNFRNKPLKYLDCWDVKKNNFIDLEPDNNFDIDLVADNFIEDIFLATWNDYLIDLGFYGNYHDNRKGFFRLYVIKGDFLNGTLYESFISRSTTEIKNKIDTYFDIIPKYILDEIQGHVFGNLTHNAFDDFDIYSAIDKIKIKLTEERLKKI